MKPNVGIGVLWSAGVLLSLSAVGISGCEVVQPEPPEEARLAGDWSTTDENGEPAGVRFDDEGQLQGIVTRDDSGDVIVLVINDSTTTVEGDDVTVEVSTAAGDAVFTGVLSADDNTLTGSLTLAIEVSDEITVVIPEGERVLTRVSDAACFLIECPDGESCVDGQCVVVDACASVVCTNGEECVDGLCEPLDPCADVVCTNGEVCVDGVCGPDESDESDPLSGQSFYQLRSGDSLFGPDAPGAGDSKLAGMGASAILMQFNGAVLHPAGVNGLTQTDTCYPAALVASAESA